MEYSVGNTLRVDGDVYDIIGKIKYKNINDNACWFEYRMKARDYDREKWLSYDMAYDEFSLSEVAWNISTFGYHLVENGTEEVVGAWGDVDVEIGDRATFKEYEDSTEEKIISVEVWDDGEETSKGYYLNIDEISLFSGGIDSSAYFEEDTPYSGGLKISSNIKGTKNGLVIAIIAIIIFFNIFGAPFLNLLIKPPTISKYLKKSPQYSYVTSITGQQKEKADVYQSTNTLDETVTDIINAIEGNTENVQQNTEDGDNSVGIITKKEYCLVYVSEDNQVLVQVSSRKYAYVSDNSPYRANRYTHRYYRRYYHSRGYYSDMLDFGKYSSPYSTYNDSNLDYSTSDYYDTYSGSVREASAYSRYSSGGGISSGK